MGRMSISEAAERLGVNVQRVHQRIAEGSLRAERVGSQWTIDEADLVRIDQHGAGRPLSGRSAWDLIVVTLLEDGRPSIPDALFQAFENADPRSHSREDLSRRLTEAAHALSASRKSRAKTRLRELTSGAAEKSPDQVASQVRGLLRRRADRQLFRVSPRDVGSLRTDSRLSLAGASLPVAELSSAEIVEAYVGDVDVDQLMRDYLMFPGAPRDANVVLHTVSEDQVNLLGLQSLSWLAIAADLADHQRPREVARAAGLVTHAARHPQGWNA